LSFNKVVVTHFRIILENRGPAAGTINGRLAAVRRLAYEAADTHLLSPELAAGICRVKGVRKFGVRLGNWLTAGEARRLCQAPDANKLKGKRDRAILAVLLGCGLRRRELADLDFTHLQQREEHWAIVDLVGKGGHIRTVPVPSWVKTTVDDWVAAAELKPGKLFRCVCRAGKCWGEGVTERLVWHVVKQYAGKLGFRAVAPHDLRRSCAKLCHTAGGELEQIQFLLGHVSVQTTERYLGCKQRIRGAVNDRIGIEP
jgi:site-specific recombinase XerD